MARVNMVDVPIWVGAIGTAVAALGTVGTLIAALVQIGSERKRRLEDADKDRAERSLRPSTADFRCACGHRSAGRTPCHESSPRAPCKQFLRTCGTGSWLAPCLFKELAPATLEEMVAHFAKKPSGPGPFTTVSILPSGLFEVSIPYAGGVMAGRLAIEVAFTDRDGHFWIRRATGQLQELQQEPFDHFRQLGLWGHIDSIRRSGPNELL